MEHEIENKHEGLSPEAKEKAIIKEMLPFFFYAAIPLAIAITIAKIWGPAY